MLFLLHIISLDSQFTNNKTGMAGTQGSQSINNNLIRPGDDCYQLQSGLDRLNQWIVFFRAL